MIIKQKKWRCIIHTQWNEEYTAIRTKKRGTPEGRRRKKYKQHLTKDYFELLLKIQFNMKNLTKKKPVVK